MKYDAVKELNNRKCCIDVRKIFENNLGSETAWQVWQNAIKKLS